MWIANNLWGEREYGRVHYLSGLCPLDVDEGIVEEPIFMGIHNIWKAQLKNVSTHLLKWAFLIKVHHHGDSETLPTEPPGEFQGMLTEFQGLFGEATYANLQEPRQTDFSSKTDPNGKLLLHSPHPIFSRDEEELG